MKPTPIVLAAAIAASLLSACGTGSGTAAAEFSQQSLRADASYDFWIVNHAGAALYVVNDYYAECLSKQLPSTHVDPKSTAGFVIETSHSGNCANSSKYGWVTLDYGNGLLNVTYHIRPHSAHWELGGFGHGSIAPFTGPAPVTIACSVNRAGNPDCTVKSGKPH